MKKLLGIVVLGIGIVLSIANSTFAIDGCDFNTVDGNPITSSYGDLEDQHVCETNDVMDINSGTMTYESQTIRAASVNNFTLTNSGTIQATDTIAINSTGNIVTINNSGTIKATNNYAIKGYGDTLNLTNSGTIQATAYGLHATGASGIVSNSGKIYGTTKIAILVNGDGHKITNQSGGLIRAGTSDSTLAAHKLAVQAGGSGTNLTLDNYGTISAAYNTIKTAATGMTITNYSGGTIEVRSGSSKAIFVDGNNTTITNKGTITATDGSNTINVDSGITGTNIVLDDSPTFTGEIDLESTATTLTLSCGLSKDIDLELENKTNMTVTNNLCGNDTYEILDSSKNADGDNSEDDGFIRIDEGLEVVSNNAKYRSENVSTKLKGLFNAANYINSGGPEDKFFRVFYSNVKRENMYKGIMAGVVWQLSPINWGPVASNIFLGYSKHNGDFDNGEFLGGGNYALGLKNVFTKNGVKISFSPMIGLNDLDVTDHDSDSGAKIKTNLLSEFLAINGKIDKEIKTSEEGSLNLSVQSTLGMQRFSDYISKFSDGDLSVDESIEQILSGGFEVKYNEELGKGFVISPYVGASLNRNLNNNIDIVADDDNISTSPAYSVTSGYYAGLTLNKEAKDINFGLDLMYGNEDGLINQIAFVSLTKSFGKAKKEKVILEPVPNLPKIDESLTTQDYNKTFKELAMLRDLNKKIKVENVKLKAQNEKLKLLAQKTLEENEVSKKLIVELLKENEKVKLENQIFKNRILENENKELIEQLEGSNAGNKPSRIFLLIFGTILGIGVLGSVKLVTLSTAWIYNRMIVSKSS